MAVASASEIQPKRNTLIDNQLHNSKRQKGRELGKDSFLTIMVAQLKNQDPLNPLEGTEFTTQLVQFSSLEQALNSNNNLTAIRNFLESSKTDDSVFDYIGKEIVSNGNPITLDKGNIIGGYFTMDKPAKVSVMVYDSYGNKVRQMLPESYFAGTHIINWDGTNDAGEKLGDGKYRYQVVGRDEKGNYVEIKTSMAGIADAIEHAGSKSYLLVSGRKVDLASIVKVQILKQEDTVEKTN